MSQANGVTRRPPRPNPLPINPKGIASAMSDRDNWVCWRYAWQANKDGKGAWKKPPYNARTGKKASVTAPEAWCEFLEVMDLWEKGTYEGVGLVLVDERKDPGDLTLYCLDIDDCEDPVSGAIDDEAMAVIARLDSYTEVSPSGTGVHVFFFADLPTVGSRTGRYELYAAGRYIAVTGRRVPNTKPEVMRRDAEAPNVAFDLRIVPARRVSPANAGRSEGLLDAEVIERCERGPGRHTFTELHNGKDAHLTSTSEADLSFCSRLAFYTQDPAQIERIWQACPRWREKCSGHPTYVKDTIRKAIETKATYFDPNFRSGKPQRPHDPAMTDDPDTTKAPSPPFVAVPPPPPTCVSQVPSGGCGDSKPVRSVRRASELKQRDTTWFIQGWIPRAELSLVVGPPNSGKSTFSTWLISQARSAVVLPGHEESIDGLFLSRLTALCKSIEHVYLLEGLDWVLPSNAKHLAAQVRATGADLLLLDPVDSYLDDSLSENDAKAVRSALESLVRIAHSTGAAVVAVRHPGKVAGNICPGSRAWRAVPRVVVELVVGIESPPTRFMHLDKDSVGAMTPDTYYELQTTGEGKPRRFVLGESVDRASADVARTVTCLMERRKLDVACDLLKQLLADGEQEAGWILRAGRELGLSDGTLYMAADRMAVTKRAEGGGKAAKHFWVPPKEWVQQTIQTDTGGGGCVSP